MTLSGHAWWTRGELRYFEARLVFPAVALLRLDIRGEEESFEGGEPKIGVCRECRTLVFED